MRVKLLTIGGMGVLLLALGCRTPKPNLKPDKMPEVANAPPSESRFDSPTYPKQAFADRDPLKKLYPDQDVMPVRGPMQGGLTSPGPVR